MRHAERPRGGIKSETESYTLDGSESHLGSGMFGFQRVRTRWPDLKDNPTSMASGPLRPWLQGGSARTRPAMCRCTPASEKGGWAAEHAWEAAACE
ncbi:hypothetical protein DL765_009593 [Monosporascus sp. GIB2]|nr:hypothetical protein DL765_009593 [Monosporascus sp. GIB2]